MSINQIILTGFVGADAVIRTMPSGKKVASFSIATNKYKNKEHITQWLNVVVYNEYFIKRCEERVKKGVRVSALGELNIEKYTTKDGQEKQKVEIVISQFKGELEVFSVEKSGDGNVIANNSQQPIQEETFEEMPF